LDEFVIGQEKAKKILAVAVFNHYSRVNENIRQQQIQESLTPFQTSSTTTPSVPAPIMYGSAIQMMEDASAAPANQRNTDTTRGTPESQSAQVLPTHGGKDLDRVVCEAFLFCRTDLVTLFFLFVMGKIQSLNSCDPISSSTTVGQRCQQ